MKVFLPGPTNQVEAERLAQDITSVVLAVLAVGGDNLAILNAIRHLVGAPTK